LASGPDTPAPSATHACRASLTNLDEVTFDSLHNYPHAVVFAVLVPVSVLTLAALAFAFWRE